MNNQDRLKLNLLSILQASSLSTYENTPKYSNVYNSVTFHNFIELSSLSERNSI
jgi:hypothetical protein